MTNEGESSFVSAEPAQRPSALRLPYVDGIRGASACYVVLFHMYQFAGARFTGAPPSWWKASKILSYGDCGVAVFIVVSGYCLMMPVAADRELRLRGGPRHFAERRLRRLGPGYVAALLFSSAIILLIPSLQHHSGTLWDATLPAFSAGTIAAHVFLIYNWSRTWRYEIDTPMWTVALEVQIYAVFVFALLPLWRRMVGRRPNLMVVFACALLTAVLMVLGLSWAQPWMLVLFALGMCAAEAARRPVGWLAGHVDLAVGAAMAFVVVTLAVERRFLHAYDSVNFVRETAVGVAAAVLLLALRKATPTDGRYTLWIGDALSRRPITWLGEISYSLYLIHFPIVGAISFGWIWGAGLGIPENFALILLIGGTFSLIAATAFHGLFERRYLSRRQPSLAPA